MDIIDAYNAAYGGGLDLGHGQRAPPLGDGHAHGDGWRDDIRKTLTVDGIEFGLVARNLEIHGR